MALTSVRTLTRGGGESVPAPSVFLVIVGLAEGGATGGGSSCPALFAKNSSKKRLPRAEILAGRRKQQSQTTSNDGNASESDEAKAYATPSNLSFRVCDLVPSETVPLHGTSASFRGLAVVARGSRNVERHASPCGVLSPEQNVCLESSHLIYLQVQP